jgi:ketosteroid isomerase-like protein
MVFVYAFLFRVWADVRPLRLPGITRRCRGLLMKPASIDTPSQLLAQLTAAMNGRDLAAFVECFDPDYESEQPAHPDRRFRGRGKVEQNWAAMFAGLPDFRAEVVRSVVEGDNVWVEWTWTGTRVDGTRLDTRGACIFGVRAGRLVWGRLYMEDVAIGHGIQAAVASLATGRSAASPAGPAGQDPLDTA